MQNKKLTYNINNVQPLSHNQVRRLQRQWHKTITQAINKLSTKMQNTSERRELRGFIVTKLRAHTKISGLYNIKDTSERMPQEAFTVEQINAFKLARQNKIKTYGYGIDNTKQSRLYFPIDFPSFSHTYTRIEHILKEKGYHISDYKNGYAVNASTKRQTRIGKLIRENKGLLRDFAKDNSRYLFNAAFVISDRAEDISMMSTSRRWTSCTNASEHKADKKIIKDIENGTLIGYLIDETDPYILSPRARVLLKPLRNQTGETIYYVDKFYGNSCDQLEEFTQRISKQISSKAPGLFKLAFNTYSNHTPRRLFRAPSNASPEKVLSLLQVPYAKHRGKITAHSSINLSNLNISLLPDMSNVTIMGDYDCSDNKLSSLRGAPSSVHGDFNCKANKLQNLKGAPQSITGSFNCAMNELRSLSGGPRTVNGTYDCKFNQLKSLNGIPKKIHWLFSDFGTYIDRQDIPKNTFTP